MDENNPNVIGIKILLNMKHLLLPDDFDWEVYIDLNHDLKNMNKNQAKIHYILHGNYEGRSYIIEKQKYECDKQEFQKLYGNIKVINIQNWFNRIGNNITQVINTIQIALYSNYDIIIHPSHDYMHKKYIVINDKLTDIDINTILSNLSYINSCNILRNEFFYINKIHELSDNLDKIQTSNLSNVINILQPCFKVPKDELQYRLSERDAVLYVRTGDIFTTNCIATGYIPPPISYYDDIINRNIFDNIVVVTEDIYDPYIIELKRRHPKLITSSQSLNLSIKYILDCTTLIDGFSHFSSGIALLSKKLKIIYKPSYQSTMYSKFYNVMGVTEYVTQLSDYWRSMSPWKFHPDIYDKLFTIKPPTATIRLLRNRPYKIYVSLTSIINQSLLPDGIFLYLSTDEYLLDTGFTNKILCKNLQNLLIKNKGLIHIKWVKNTGPYRKITNLMKEKRNENCVIITIDDDFIYPPTLIDTHIHYYNIYRCDIGFRGKTHKCNPFNYMNPSEFEHKTKYNLPTGLGSILYMVCSYTKFLHILDDEQLIKIAKCNDDILLYILRIITNTPVFINNDVFNFSQAMCNEVSLFKQFNNYKLNKNALCNNTIVYNQIIDHLKHNHHIEIVD